MADGRNFLLGKGERLTEPVSVSHTGRAKEMPYSFQQARSRLVPMLTSTSDSLNALPDAACPKGEALSAITLHPEFLAKSYFPEGLLRAVGLRSVGSRSRVITPQGRTRGRQPEEALTTQLFVAGQRRNFTQWANGLPNWTPHTSGADELAKLERVRYLTPEERVKSIYTDQEELLFEVVLHAREMRDDDYILEAFNAFTDHLGLKADLDNRLYAGGLCFVRLEAPRNEIKKVAQFSFLRAAREMPKLRVTRPVVTRGKSPLPSVNLPTEGPVEPDLRVAVFDGGLPPNTPLAPWVSSFDAGDVGIAEPGHLGHGQAMTSAFLFGSMALASEGERPFAYVHHYRVLDKDSEGDPYELYDVLRRIQDVLSTNQYEYVNLSLGPALPIEDDDIHAWTAVLDDFVSDNGSLITIAVGNNGESDEALGFNRIQVPADCVNGLSLGACDSSSETWGRALYSAVGPGRSPGLVKPDLVTFGGDDKEPFWVVDTADSTPGLVGVSGTSFAAPAALRLGLGVRAHLGPSLSPLAIKSLLVHTSEATSHHRSEVGWGRLAQDLDSVVTCPDGVVRVLYQGKLTASKYLRSSIPLPNEQLQGNVKITATFCFSTAVDPAHPSTYTRSGLDVVFRPNEDIRSNEEAMHAKSDSFFKPADMYTGEDVLRRDAHKWETCLHQSVTKRGSSLKNPVFDVHYVSRIEGKSSRSNEQIDYALVVTVESPKTKDLYDRVLRRYQTILEPLTPAIEVPIRSHT